MIRFEATKISTDYRIPLNVDFHTLGADTVGRILEAADARKYRAPKNANGSRARYFHAMLVRAFNAKVPEYVVQGHCGHGWEHLSCAELRPCNQQTVNLLE